MTEPTETGRKFARPTPDSDEVRQVRGVGSIPATASTYQIEAPAGFDRYAWRGGNGDNYSYENRGGNTDYVTPEQIAEQRAARWPDFHPETYCHRCGRRNATWFADSALWNAAEPNAYIILCPVCFITDYEAATGNDKIVWRVAPAEFSDQVSTLIQSEAAMRHERDALQVKLDAVRALADKWEAKDSDVMSIRFAVFGLRDALNGGE